MTQNFERAKSRLENISSIEPLLGALRTLSMGTWQMALNKISQIKEYEENFDHILREILPEINRSRRNRRKAERQPTEITDTIFLMIGTERGLCGKFNEILIDNALKWIGDQGISSYQIWAMGSRLIQKLETRGIEFNWHQALPASDLTSYQKSYTTTQEWLDQFENHDFDSFFILYNQLKTGGHYRFSTFQLLPFEISDLHVTQKQVTKKWPPPIIETDPKGIYRRIIQNYIASSYYLLLLKSAAAEHAARYNLMEEAKENADDIIEELRQVINIERKRKITQQMQELAAGSGLLDNK
jgi:F-type H+-transporting ATPase subunit gamma